MYALLLVFLLPTLGVPLVYFTGKKSEKLAAILVALLALICIGLVASTIPDVLNNSNHKYVEEYAWIPVLNTHFTLFTDGISISIAIVSLTLILVAALFSINYMHGKKNLPVILCSSHITQRRISRRLYYIKPFAFLLLLGINACSCILHRGRMGLPRLLQSSIQTFRIYTRRCSFCAPRHRRHLYDNWGNRHVPCPASTNEYSPRHCTIGSDSFHCWVRR